MEILEYPDYPYTLSDPRFSSIVVRWIPGQVGNARRHNRRGNDKGAAWAEMTVQRQGKLFPVKLAGELNGVIFILDNFPDVIAVNTFVFQIFNHGGFLSGNR